MMGFFCRRDCCQLLFSLTSWESQTQGRGQKTRGGGQSPDFLILVWFPASLLKCLWDLKVHLLFLGISSAMEGSKRDWKLHLELSMNDAEKKCWPSGVTGLFVSVLTRLLERWEISTGREKQRHSAHSDKSPATARWGGRDQDIASLADTESRIIFSLQSGCACCPAGTVDFSPELLLASQCGAPRDIF